MMNPLFLFDVDGTLTPSRKRVNIVFQAFLSVFADENDCALVTGSDKAKTLEQLTPTLYDLFSTQFQCNGNEIYQGADNLVYSSDWTLPNECKGWLSSVLKDSTFPLRTGNHIEERNGMVNFSIVGRNATLGERKMYVKFDTDNGDRAHISAAFNARFSEKYKVRSTIGGETGLDITPIGKDKGQVLDHYPDREIYFFGDACEPGGNDYPLAKLITEKQCGSVYNVSGYEETWKILRGIKDAIS